MCRGRPSPVRRRRRSMASACADRRAGRRARSRPAPTRANVARGHARRRGVAQTAAGGHEEGRPARRAERSRSPGAPAAASPAAAAGGRPPRRTATTTGADGGRGRRRSRPCRRDVPAPMLAWARPMRATATARKPQPRRRCWAAPTAWTAPRSAPSDVRFALMLRVALRLAARSDRGLDRRHQPNAAAALTAPRYRGGPAVGTVVATAGEPGRHEGS